jgi:hypothetical protein
MERLNGIVVVDRMLGGKANTPIFNAFCVKTPFCVCVWYGSFFLARTIQIRLDWYVLRPGLATTKLYGGLFNDYNPQFVITITLIKAPAKLISLMTLFPMDVDTRCGVPKSPRPAIDRNTTCSNRRPRRGGTSNIRRGGVIEEDNTVN